MLKILKIFIFLFSIPCFAADPFQLSLEEKVGQLLMVHFHGEAANEDARILIQEIGVGGIVYYNWSNGLHSPKQVHSLSLSLQELVKDNRFPIPLFIATDQEGGEVARLNQGFTQFPGNQALGETHNPHLAKISALAMGQELQTVGINMNFAPVVDVNSNPRNPIIGIRSYGSDPETVIAFGAEALQGFKQANIMTTLKHFPGHGDVDIDSHEDLPIIYKSIEELEDSELLPFSRLAANADLVMTAHILVPALDNEYCATLSTKTLNYLKDKIGFQGVIISDSLVMEGILKKYNTVDEAAIQALNAGCDLLLLGGKQLIGGHSNLELTVSDVRRIHNSIVTAVKSGRISEERLNQAIEKVLSLKSRYLNHKISDLPNLTQLVNSLSHQEIAKKIASEALVVITHETISSLNTKKIAVFAPQLLRRSIMQTSLLNIGKETDSLFFDNVNLSNEEIEAVKKKAQAADVLLICSYNAWKTSTQAAFIQSLQKMGKPAILLVVGNPLDASLYPKANLIFITFSPTIPSIEAVCNQLRERNFRKTKNSGFFNCIYN